MAMMKKMPSLKILRCHQMFGGRSKWKAINKPRLVGGGRERGVIYQKDDEDDDDDLDDDDDRW